MAEQSTGSSGQDARYGPPSFPMRPPEWALNGSTRLGLDEFTAEFCRAWSRMGSRFLKVECWQSYQEAVTNRSQDAFQRGDVDVARTLLRQEAEDDRPLYDDVHRRNIDYARIRLIREPLSPYLEYELVNYGIRASLGERIDVVLIDPRDPLPVPTGSTSCCSTGTPPSFTTTAREAWGIRSAAG